MTVSIEAKKEPVDGEPSAAFLETRIEPQQFAREVHSLISQLLKCSPVLPLFSVFHQRDEKVDNKQHTPGGQWERPPSLMSL